MAPLLTKESKTAPKYSTWYITTHKAACRTAAFSIDGKFIATGSTDTSLKILDVSKMNVKSDEEKPVVRTLYDHVGVKR
jgi:cleavage stimulation factor subunit 1